MNILISSVRDMFSLSFMVYALISGILISVCASLLGVSLVLKRYSMIGDGLSHVAFGSLAIAAAMNIAPLKLAIPVVIVSAFLLLRLNEKGKLKGDAVTALISTGALAVGVMAVSLSTGMNIDIYNYMFGSILGTTDADLYLSIPLGLVVIAAFILLYNRLFMVTYDEVYAKACGINVTLYQFFISLLTAITVVIGMRMMGTLLIASLIIFPALISKRLVRSFKSVVVVSSFVSVICFLIGLVLSFFLDLPVGAFIVAVNMLALLIAAVISKVKN